MDLKSKAAKNRKNKGKCYDITDIIMSFMSWIQDLFIRKYYYYYLLINQLLLYYIIWAYNNWETMKN